MIPTPIPEDAAAFAVAARLPDGTWVVTDVEIIPDLDQSPPGCRYEVDPIEQNREPER